MDFTNRILSEYCIQDASLGFTYVDTIGYIDGEQVVRRDRLDIFSGNVIASAYSDGSDGTGWSNDPSDAGTKVVAGRNVSTTNINLPAGVTKFTITAAGADTFSVSFDNGTTTLLTARTGTRTRGNGTTIIEASDQIKITTVGVVDVIREF